MKYLVTDIEFDFTDSQGELDKWEQDQIAHMKEYIARFGHGSSKLAKQAQSKEPCTTRTASFLNAFLAGGGCSLRLTHSALPSCWCDVLHHIDWNLHSAQLLVLCASTFLTISVLQMGAAAGQTERASTSSDVLPLAQSSDKLGSSMWTFGASMSKARRCAAGIEQNSRAHC